MAARFRQVVKPKKRRSLLLLLVPLSACGLGVWQLQRLQWKKELIRNLNAQLGADPVEIPTNLDALEDMEYRRVSLRGTFDHANEMLVGPRTLLRDDSQSQGSPQTGSHVVTPFTLTTGSKILVNRGFVPDKFANPEQRPEPPATAPGLINAIVRVTAKSKPPFIPENNPERNEWYWADVKTMAKLTGSQPHLVDACADATPSGGLPVGGQTQITVRNQHLEYSLTWFSLAVATLAIWAM